MEKKVIRKYEIEVDEDYVVDIPENGEILHLGIQCNQIYIWVKVNPNNKEVKRHFKSVGTGHPIESDEESNLSYIGTVHLMNGSFVFHIFEII